MRVSEVEKNYPDNRLKSPQFRRDVRLVLDAKEGESVLDEFMKYRDIIDWTVFARNIRKPRFGLIVEMVALPGTELLKWIPGRDNAEAVKNLAECYRFLSLW